MQALTLSHWIDELSKSIKHACDGASECVQQVAIRGHTNGDDIVRGAELALSTLDQASTSLIALRAATSADDTVKHLSALEGHSNWLQHGTNVYMKSDTDGSSEEVHDAVMQFRDAVGVLAANVSQIMNLDSVQEARMSHRAHSAKDKARAIAEKLAS